MSWCQMKGEEMGRRRADEERMGWAREQSLRNVGGKNIEGRVLGMFMQKQWPSGSFKDVHRNGRVGRICEGPLAAVWFTQAGNHGRAFRAIKKRRECRSRGKEEMATCKAESVPCPSAPPSLPATAYSQVQPTYHRGVLPTSPPYGARCNLLYTVRSACLPTIWRQVQSTLHCLPASPPHGARCNLPLQCK